MKIHLFKQEGSDVENTPFFGWLHKNKIWYKQMKIKILFFITIFISYYLGNDFGVSLFSYFDIGEFQSALRDFGVSPAKEILAGIFSSFFTVISAIIYNKVVKVRIMYNYIISIMIIYLMQFIANWKEGSNFRISELAHIFSYVFINIEFTIFCIISYLMLKILKNLDYLN